MLQPETPPSQPENAKKEKLREFRRKIKRKSKRKLRAKSVPFAEIPMFYSRRNCVCFRTKEMPCRKENSHPTGVWGGRNEVFRIVA